MKNQSIQVMQLLFHGKELKMGSMGENTCKKKYKCRICKGTGIKLYYYPINKPGDCPNCNGKKYVDWVTNITGAKSNLIVWPPILSAPEKFYYDMYQAYCKEYGEDYIKIVAPTEGKFWVFVEKDKRMKEIKDKQEREARWRAGGNYYDW